MFRKTALLLLVSSCVTVIADLTCPDSDGQTYTTSSGSVFQVECGVDHSGGDMGSSTTNSFSACMDLCATTTGCVDVSYSGVACYMKSTVGASVNNGVRGGRLISNGNTNSMSTTTTTQSTAAPAVNNKAAAATSLACPNSDGQNYTSQGGATFLIECGIDHAGGDMQMNYTSTFQSCIDICSTVKGCVDVSYAGSACYLKSTLGAAGSNSNVYGAKLVTSSASGTASTAPNTAGTSNTPALTSSSLTSSSKTTSATPSTATTSTLSCPASDGTTFSATNGAVYVVKCGMDGQGNDISNQQTASLDACLNLCSTTANCKAVSWVPGQPGPCYMKKAFVNPSTNSGVWGAYLSSSSSSSTAPSTMITMTSSKSSSTITASSSSSSVTPTTMVTMTSSSKTSVSTSTTIPGTQNSASGCGSSLPSGFTAGGSSQTMSLVTSDGLNRTFLVYIPTKYSTTSPNALVVSYHGASNTAAGQEGLTGFSQSSTNPDMIAVYPQGVNGYWQGAPYSTAGVDDVAFTKQMLIALQSQFCVDTNRLYATGMSNGGGFTGTLACDNSASQIFAAFGAHSGAFYPGSAYPDNASCNSSTVPVTCNPGRQHIPFLEIHGNNDGQIPYTGGGHNGQCLPAIPYYMTYKATQEGYGSTNTTTQLGNGNVMYTWGTSANGIAGVVQHVMVNGLGHSWASNFNGFTSSPVILSFLKQWNLSAAV